EAEDPQRPLTDRGREEVERVAQRAAEAGIRISRILHSGKLRARQTAEIFARYLSPAQGIGEVEGLSPLDDPNMAKNLIETSPEPLMLVGHLPHLSRLASALVLGEAGREIIRFRMGGVVCLVWVGEGWQFGWALTPEVVGTD
ncbi:MAG: phosphohistidine phosphatase SixA, partial [Chloroflexi bacterium]